MSRRLMRSALTAATLAATMFWFTPTVSTQVTALPHDTGATGLGLALRQLPNDGAVLYVTAHPDDENNGVLVALNRGRGLKTSLLTVTRGDGGQNEIGSELFQAIGILRSEELAAVHRYDGADQYFTRAFEFGYSFSVEETFEKWGKEEILRDVVKVIRTVRPDVILTMNRDGQAGGQHHMGSARLAHEAFRVAADPTRFPEQLQAGLRPWQARKIYQAGGGNPGGGAALSAAGGAAPPQTPVRVPTGDFDPLLGMSWAQFGQRARANHLCQGMGQMETRPGESGGSFSLYDSEPRVTGTEEDILADVDTTVRRMARFAVGQEAAVPTLAKDLDAIYATSREAMDAFDMRAPHKTMPALVKGLGQVRALRSTVASSTLSADARQELLWRIDRKEQDFMKALQFAQGLVVHVNVADGNVVRGQSFEVTAQVFNTGPEPMTVIEVTLHVPQGWTATLKQGQPGAIAYNEAATLIYNVTVGPNARYSQPYWKRSTAKGPGSDRYEIEIPEHHLLPWSPPDVTATIKYTAGGASASLNAPAYYRYDGPWVGGEKQKVVNIVPNVSVKLTPSIAVVPVAAGGQKKEFRVSVLNNAPSASDVSVSLEVPAGWRVEPASTTLKFSVEEEEMSAQFFVTPPARVTPGEAEIRAVAVRGNETFREGYQVIAYNHIQTRHLFHPALSKVKMIDVTVPANRQVGYVMGSGDEVPDAIRQLGATVTMLSPEEVAFGDLSKYTTIVLGIRAYEKRPDLRAYNQRLFDFARAGGHLVVQYNKTAMNQLGGGQAGPPPGAFTGGGGRGGRGSAPPSSPYVPYPGGITSNRVTVEETAIRVLEDGTTEMSSPNRITAADFDGWVQERGLYFFGANDPRYTDILAATDPWAFNPGEKKGMLTVAQLGKGTWTYVGLGLWRQLPAGVPGAYRILANLIK
ncbi:MAG: PIG-L family deacetylase [Acidobacteria bacterium]|nr:PIG-L family deacetylase [Acidobacteriota bacterium]